MLSLISIIASTLKGIEYLIVNGKDIIVLLINTMKELADSQASTTNPIANSVNLRFCIAILQKISIKAQLIPIFIQNGVIEFILTKLKAHYRSAHQADLKAEFTGEQHIFFLDFSTALLANILHCKLSQEWLKNNKRECLSIAS